MERCNSGGGKRHCFVDKFIQCLGGFLENVLRVVSNINCISSKDIINNLNEQNETCKSY